MGSHDCGGSWSSSMLGWFHKSSVSLTYMYWPTMKTGRLGDFDYFTAEKLHPNLGNWAYDYLIKIGLLWSCLPWAKMPICCSLVLWNFAGCMMRLSDVLMCWWGLPTFSHQCRNCTTCSSVDRRTQLSTVLLCHHVKLTDFGTIQEFNETEFAY